MTTTSIEREVSLSDAKTKLSQLVDEVRTGAARAIEIVRHKRPVAALVGIDTLRKFQRLEDRLLCLELEEALAKGKKTPLREVLKGLDLGL